MLLSSLWGFSCYIFYGVKVIIIVIVLVLERVIGWRGILYMLCVVYLFCEIWFGLVVIGKKGGDVFGR